jgi:hypothetical protein
VRENRGLTTVSSNSGNEVRTDSPYLQPGSVEVYRERSGASPRSALSSAQHRFHMAGDSGPLTCSHLQNYDPDRALTDYISRLEALQRRLGSVQSGNRHTHTSNCTTSHHLELNNVMQKQKLPSHSITQENMCR